MNQLEEFEKYLNGLMDQGERESFEGRLRDDPVFRKDFAIHEEMYRALQNEEAINLRRKLMAGEKRYLKKGGQNRRPVRGSSKLLLAAAIIILAGLAFLVVYYRGSNNILDFGRMVAWQDNHRFRPEFILPESYYSFRDEMSLENKLEILSPPDSTLFRPGRPVSFRWKDTGKNVVFILSNWQDSIVHLEGVSGKGLRIDSMLDKGIYYYRIHTSSQLIGLGIIFIDDPR